MGRTASLDCIIGREDGANASADEAQNAAAMARLRRIIIVVISLVYEKIISYK